MQKLAQGCAAAPDHDLLGARLFGLVELAQKRGQDVGVFQIVIVPRTIKVCRLGRDEIRPVLFAIGLTQLDACDLGDRVPFVGGLQRACQ